MIVARMKLYFHCLFKFHRSFEFTYYGRFDYRDTCFGCDTCKKGFWESRPGTLEVWKKWDEMPEAPPG